MNNFTIDPKDFIKREQRVLGYLRGKACAPSILSAANKAYTGSNSRGLDFTATWPVAHKKDILEITIGGLVQLDDDDNFTFSSYTLSICRDKHLLRKYHYDLECVKNDGNEFREKKPAYHLQFGGEPLPEHDGHKGVEGLNLWLSEPRLFYTPMSLALILEQAFLEFPDVDTDKIRKDKDWKGLLLATQNEVLKPYFERCCQKIENDERLYSECYI